MIEGPRAAYPIAVAVTLLSISMFTGSHVFVRLVGSGISPFEIAFFTSLFAFAFYVPWILRTGGHGMRTPNLARHVVRSFFNAAAVSCWYIALTLVPLADAVALSLTGPMFVTLGAILLLGERARARRWTALGVGAFGALVIVRPGFEAIGGGFMFVVLGAVFSASSKLFSGFLSRTDSPAAIGAWVALLQIPITLAVAAFFWKWPSAIEWIYMAAVGLLVGAAHYTMVWAFRSAEISALEPYNFLRLILAAVFGFAIFSEVPDVWTWIGGAIIVGANTYIARREALAGRKSVPVVAGAAE
jgi:drug/metabolite transporter (DMT)-like permease